MRESRACWRVSKDGDSCALGEASWGDGLSDPVEQEGYRATSGKKTPPLDLRSFCSVLYPVPLILPIFGRRGR